MTTPLPPLPATLDVSHEFPILSRWAFFNHAGVAPLCRSAATALETYSQQALNDAYLGGDWYAQADTTRELAAKLIGASTDEIAFVKNTSEGLAFVANGLDWRAGDQIVSTAVEYPANAYPWMDVAQRFGAEHRMVSERDGRIDSADVLNAITPRTRLVSLSHVEFGSGFRVDLAAIGKVCRERGVLFCVDAIQSLGVLPLDVRAMNIDFLSADGHKWMLGPEGCGFFYCRRELLETLHPEIGWWNVVDAQNYSHYDFTLRRDAKRFECGTYNIPGVVALGAALRLLLDVGIDLIERRVCALTDQLCAGLEQKGYVVFSSRRPGETSGIVSFSAPRGDHAEIARDLKKQKIVIVTRAGRLRASPHFYNSPEQIAALLNALP